ncbi:hypothetical protein ABZ860_28095 [Microbispora sp. NPDC046973]|uniref:hypothetical protein n=1 Tax=Microbispora sp. NPDC046973 TaxID=3155022 RepID=UPI0034054F3F
MISSRWDTPLGASLTRDERMARYGGAKYGGIEPSSSTANTFIYSDPARGEAFGYNFDGWNEDGTVFLYTGEGRLGDQVWSAGNRAILEHQAKGHDLRVFVADGVVPGTAKKSHRYIGRFELDRESPYFLEEAPDEAGELRTVFVFRLRPLGEAFQREVDRSAVGDASEETQAKLISTESHNSPTFASRGSAPTTAERREAELCARYIKFLGRPLQRWSILPAGETRPLLTDLYDEQENELYEAKGTATRDAIRRGIGQLLDYRRHIKPTPKITLLLPHRPSADLFDLLQELGISCVYEDVARGFRRAPAG